MYGFLVLFYYLVHIDKIRFQLLNSVHFLYYDLFTSFSFGSISDIFLTYTEFPNLSLSCFKSLFNVILQAPK